MSVDKLQDKIRKFKNPTVVEICPDISMIPKPILEEESGFNAAFSRWGGELLESLKDIVPAVRFSFAAFSLLGSDGLELLSQVTNLAKKLDYYVILDAPVSYSEKEAMAAAQVLSDENCPWPCDGVIVCPYIGSDAIKPYAQMQEKSGKDAFVVLRTGNKTAAQLQDLLTGSRLVHIAAADIVSRMGQPYIGRRNYSNIACVGSAAAADSLRNLRGKYKNMFILVEGYDYSNANAKNCSFAFNSMGHGAVVCAGSTITAAWQESDAVDVDYRELSVEAAERMKKNLLRYITIL